ncbi:hypothetical protein RJ640_003506 [Escallonia rubra]|uniref:Myb/SANT-like domain-containing protein n=1 Tax=Escallonia rubra TaxID=112253 RepID=A0AA88R0P5_9ASTE|nr:hypothetical protein RJ640_003506 [Escallonia rubra]
MRKRTRKDGETSDKSTNFRWSITMDRLFLEMLADEATKGNKPSSSFKPTTVTKTWCTISLLRGRSGYGWDANLNMIVCDKQQYDEEVTRCPTNEKYLHKKIDMYEEMALVAGKDIAISGFSKSYGDLELEETQVDLTPLANDNEVAAKGIDGSSTATSSHGRQH